MAKYSKEQEALHNAIRSAIRDYTTGLIGDVELVQHFAYLNTRYAGMDLSNMIDMTTGLRFPVGYKL
jgi:hypothetical protein